MKERKAGERKEREGPGVGVGLGARDRLAAEKREKNLVLSGLVEVMDENTAEAVKKCVEGHWAMSPNDVVSARRIGKELPQKPRLILVELKDAATAEKWWRGRWGWQDSGKRLERDKSAEQRTREYEERKMRREHRGERSEGPMQGGGMGMREESRVGGRPWGNQGRGSWMGGIPRDWRERGVSGQWGYPVWGVGPGYGGYGGAGWGI